MKLSHTPGPWKIGYNDLSGQEILTYKNRFIACISFDDYCMNINCEITEEEKANARLIAVAPEMLNCLIEYAKFELSETDGIPEGLISVIEKATGLSIEEVLK